MRSPGIARAPSAAEPRHRPAPACFRRKQGKGLRMAVKTLRHPAKLSSRGHRPLDRMLAPLADAALKGRILTPRGSGNRLAPYDRLPSQTANRMHGPDWRGVPVLVAPSAPAPLHRAMRAFFSRVRIAPEALQIRSMVRRDGDRRGLDRAFAEQNWRACLDNLQHRAASAGIPFKELAGMLLDLKHGASSAGIPFIELPPADMSQDCPLRDPVRQGTDGASPSVRRVGPRAGPRRGRGKEPADPRPSYCRRSRAGGRDDALRVRGTLTRTSKINSLAAKSFGADGSPGNRSAGVERGIPVLHLQVAKNKSRFGKAGNGEGEQLPARI